MSSTTKAHGRLVRRLNRAVDAAVGDTCDLYLGDMTVSIAALDRDNAPRPDLVVTCDARDRSPQDASDRCIRWPKLVIEVLSPGTASNDLGAKLRAYFSIATVEEYLIVDSRARNVILHRRIEGHITTTWPELLIKLTSIDCDIPVAQLYDGIALADAR